MFHIMSSLFKLRGIYSVGGRVYHAISQSVKDEFLFMYCVDSKTVEMAPMFLECPILTAIFVQGNKTISDRRLKRQD